MVSLKLKPLIKGQYVIVILLVGWLVSQFVSLLVALLVRLCKYTSKGDFTCIYAPAYLYLTESVMYTALFCKKYFRSRDTTFYNGMI